MTKIVNLFVFFLLALTAGTSSDAPLRSSYRAQNSFVIYWTLAGSELC